MESLIRRRLMLSGAAGGNWEGLEPAEAPDGLYIQRTDGLLYTGDVWAAAGVPSTEANCVAIISGGLRLGLHPAEARAVWSNSTDSVDAVNTEYPDTDMTGRANTDAILDAVTAGTIADAPAADWARNQVYKLGQEGWLPSGGEVLLIMAHVEDLNPLLTLIGGTPVDKTGSTWYWTSVQCPYYNSVYAWVWKGYPHLKLLHTDKPYAYGCRSVCEL